MAYSRNSCFLICFGTFLTLVVAEVISDTVASTRNKTPGTPVMDCDDFCESPGCMDITKDIITNMGYHTNACDNFYEYVCSNFLPKYGIPQFSKGLMNQYSEAEEIIMRQLEYDLKKESPPNEPRSHRLAKDFYKACMNENATEERGLQPLLDNLKELGGWPVLEDQGWNEDNFNWIDFVHKSRKLGYSIDYFISLDIVKGTNNSGNEISLYPPTFGIRRKEHLKNLHITNFYSRNSVKYYEYMVDVAKILGADFHQAAKQLVRSLQFERMLAQLANNSKQYDKMTVNELYTVHAHLNLTWLVEYLNGILAPQTQLNQNDTINLNYIYLQDLKKLINDTSKKVQANYALWRVIDASAGYLTDVIRNRRNELYEEIKPRWKECVNLVSRHLDFSVGSMYFKTEDRDGIFEMFSYIKNEFRRTLEKAEWMDEKTRANALKKIDSMEPNVIYPKKFLNINKLDKFYEKLELSADNLLGNILNITIFKMNVLFDSLHKSVNENRLARLKIKPIAIDVSYSPRVNNILISIGIMRSLFYSDDRPYYVNFGAIGSLIAREIMHSFDNFGIHYDDTGEEVEWSEPETKENFLNRVQCLIDQYGNYTLDDIHLDGNKTLRENIADYVGVKIAYYTYERLVKQNELEEQLTILCYTPKQFFWMSYATTMCHYKYRLKLLKDEVLNGRYSPPEFRVNGVLSNIEEFSRDFYCEVGSKMNPVKKCNVW